MNRRLQTVLRWILTIGLLYGVYMETGPFTVVAFGLIFVFAEITTLLLLNTGRSEWSAKRHGQGWSGGR